MHGRSVPPSGRDLLAEFTAALHRWEWDVALLQEVPPWWPSALARSLHAEQRTVLTSRNALLALRRVVAVRAPDLIKSNGGGANTILARVDRIVDHRRRRLCWLPERRWVHGVSLGCGVWIGNLHATAGDTAGAQRDLQAAAAATREWAAAAGVGGAYVLGGDFNLRSVAADGLVDVACRDVDHVLIGPGVRTASDVRKLDAGPLSDHVPLAVTLDVDLGRGL